MSVAEKELKKMRKAVEVPKMFSLWWDSLDKNSRESFVSFIPDRLLRNSFLKKFNQLSDLHQRKIYTLCQRMNKQFKLAGL